MKHEEELSKKDQLARFIFLAVDYSSIHRLRLFLARHPHLWLTLSVTVKSSVEDLLYGTDQIECLVNGAQNFIHR